MDLNKIKVEIAPAGRGLHQRDARRPDHRRLDLGRARATTSCASPARRRARCSCRPRRRSGASSRSTAHAKNGMVIGPAGKKATYGQLAEAASKLPPPKDVKLKDPKEFTLRRQAGQAPRHAGQDQRHARVRHRREAAGHAVRVARAVPGDRRQGRELRRRRGAKPMPGVKHVVQITDGVAVVADIWWQAKRRATRSTINWDEGARRDAQLRRRLQRADGRCREARRQHQEAGDVDAAHEGRGEDGRGDVRAAVPRPRADGADELHRRRAEGLVRCYRPDASSSRSRRAWPRRSPGSSPSRSRSRRRSSAAASGAASTSTTSPGRRDLQGGRRAGEAACGHAKTT